MKRKNWSRNLLALAFGLSIFPILEIILVIFRVNPDLGRNMGNFGIENKVPVFEKVENRGKTYWCPSKQWFGKMRYYKTSIRRFFEMPRPEGASRIFAIGGSSAAGYPFGPMAAFSEWLELMLNGSSTGIRYEVINLGINGIGSYEVKRLMPQVLAARPDLVVIYLGHNDCMIEKSYSGSLWLDGLASRISHELLRFRLYRLMFKVYHNDNSERRKAVFMYYGKLRKKGLRPERNKYFYPPEERKKVAKNITRNLKDIIRMTEKAKVPLVLCTVESNVLDMAPEGSVHGRSLNSQELKEWEELYGNGNKSYGAGNYDAALEYYGKASAIDDGYALLRYRMGRSLTALGRYEDGEKELRAAIDLSDLPVQAQSFINPVIREQSKNNLVYLADVEKAFKAVNQGKAPGDDWFLDRMHPNIDGHRFIAKVIFQTMVENKLAPAPRESSSAPVETALENYARSLPREYLYENYFFMAIEGEFTGRIRRAVQMSEKALSYIPEDKMASEVMIRRMNSMYGNLDTNE